MPSLGQRGSRQRSITTLGLASALLIATCAPLTVAAAQTETSERKHMLEERRDANAQAQRKAHELRVQMDELQAEAVQALSKRRADAVKAYLIRRDIAPNRLTACVSSEALPDPEDSATPPQPLRRIEVIIEDPAASVTSSM